MTSMTAAVPTVNPAARLRQADAILRGAIPVSPRQIAEARVLIRAAIRDLDLDGPGEIPPTCTAADRETWGRIAITDFQGFSPTPRNA